MRVGSSWSSWLHVPLSWHSGPSAPVSSEPTSKIGVCEVEPDDDSTPVSVCGSVDVDASVASPLVVGAEVDGSVVVATVVVNGAVVVVSSPLPVPGHAASAVQTVRAATIRLELFDMVTSASRMTRAK